MNDDRAEPWYRSDLMILVALIACAPLGSYLLWSSKRLTLGTKLLVTMLLGLLSLAGMRKEMRAFQDSTGSDALSSPASEP